MNNMADQPVVKRKVPPKPQPMQTKRKKGPSKPQPAWLFPPDEENPVLNPKEKSHDAVEKAIKEREKAIDYMHRRVHGVPDRPAPDPLLLTLIGIFLTDFGFNSTSRLFTNERQARRTLNGWEDALGKKIDKKTPKLEQIFRDWHRDWLVKQADETSSDSSSEASGEDVSQVESQTPQDAPRVGNEGSNANSVGSDVEMKDVPQSQKAKKANRKMASSPPPSVSSSSPESDADDEKEDPEPEAESLPKKVAQIVTPQPTVGEMVNKLKRKAHSRSPELPSDAPIHPKPTKVKKLKTENVLPKPVTSAKSSSVANIKDKSIISTHNTSTKSLKSAKAKNENDISTSTKSSKATKSKSQKVKAAPPPVSDESSTSYSESDKVEKSKPQQDTTYSALATSSDSSATINGDSKKPSANASPASISSSITSTSSSSSSSGLDAVAPVKESKATPSVITEAVKAKRPSKGAKPTPLAELSEAAGADTHPSNEYQSYEYANKAYKDLSVTRGKGFKREKDKKKRGSYRGGAIDTSGGRSFKFED